MRVDVEIIPYSFIRHVIDSEKVPSVISYFSIIFRVVWILSPIKKF